MVSPSIVDLAQIRTAVQRLLEATQLPDELCDMIAALLEPNDIFLFAYLSKRLNQVINEILYRNIIFDWGRIPSISWNKQPVVHLLLRTLLTNPSLAQRIHSFKLIGSPLQCLHNVWDIQFEDYSLEKPPWNWREMPKDGPFHSIAFNLSSYSKMEHLQYELSTLTLVANNATAFTAAPASNVDKRVLSQLLKRLQSLRHIRVDADFFFCPYVRAELCEMLKDPSSSSLRTVEFFSNLDKQNVFEYHHGIFAADTFCKAALEAPLALSNVEVLRTAADLGQGLPNQQLAYPNLRAISLVVPRLTRESAGLEKLLLAASNLESLSLNLNTDYIWFNMTYGPHSHPNDFPLFEILRHVKHSLRHLSLTEKRFLSVPQHYGTLPEEYEKYRYPWRPETCFRRPNALVDFTRLESLKLPALWVLGRASERAASTPCWRDMFPRSLRDVTWAREPVMCTLNGQLDKNAIVDALPSFFEWFSSCRTGAEELRFSVHHESDDWHLYEYLKEEVLPYDGAHYGIICRFVNPGGQFDYLELLDSERKIYDSTPGWEWPLSNRGAIRRGWYR